jgi:hypothetical protein
MSKRLSNSFAGSTTRAKKDFSREVETRMAGGDMFTEDFGGGGANERSRGQDFDKDNGGYQKPHDDFTPHKQYQPAKVSSAMAAAGNAEDQEMLDQVDDLTQKFEGAIKKWNDQFPGSFKMTGRDKHLATLSYEVHNGHRISVYRKFKEFHPLVDGHIIRDAHPNERLAIEAGKAWVDSHYTGSKKI